MCVLIRLSIFENIFLKIEKIINIFSNLEKKFSKNKNYCVPAHLNKIQKKNANN